MELGKLPFSMVLFMFIHFRGYCQDIEIEYFMFNLYRRDLTRIRKKHNIYSPKINLLNLQFKDLGLVLFYNKLYCKTIQNPEGV